MNPIFLKKTFWFSSKMLNMMNFRMTGSRTPQPLPTSGPLLPAPGMLPQSGIRPLNPRGKKTENSFKCLSF